MPGQGRLELGGRLLALAAVQQQVGKVFAADGHAARGVGVGGIETGQPLEPVERAARVGHGGLEVSRAPLDVGEFLVGDGEVALDVHVDGRRRGHGLADGERLPVCDARVGPPRRQLVDRADALVRQSDVASHTLVRRGGLVQRPDSQQGLVVLRHGRIRSAEIGQVRVAEQVAQLDLPDHRLQAIVGRHAGPGRNAGKSHRRRLSMRQRGFLVAHPRQHVGEPAVCQREGARRIEVGGVGRDQRASDVDGPPVTRTSARRVTDVGTRRVPLRITHLDEPGREFAPQ